MVQFHIDILNNKKMQVSNVTFVTSVAQEWPICQISNIMTCYNAGIIV
jgi:hypothetical protein